MDDDIQKVNEKPSQQEIDIVAHFVEAVRELRHSPFFIEEYKNLSISMQEGASKDEIKGHFPDPNIIRAMLVPFRRLWQQNEPCNYLKVAKIIKKYIPNFRGFIDSILPDKKSTTSVLPLFKDIDLSVFDVIDLWLNTKFMHIGSTNRHGRFKRSDFERFSREIGQVMFEFYFLLALQEVGICFFNMQQCAESFLKGFSKQGLSPSFTMHTDIENDSVERSTPGFTPKLDTPDQKVWRLRRRNHYDGFNKFLDLIHCTDYDVARLLDRCETFDDFTAGANVLLEETNNISSIDKGNITHFGGCIDNYPTVIRNRHSRRGFVVKQRDGKLIWSEDYIPVLRDQYLEFRNAFKQEVFMR